MPVAPNPPDRPVQAPPREAVQRWRMRLARAPLSTDSGQREQLTAWEAALVASGLPVAGLDAVPPKVRFAPAAPLAAAVPGEAELADLWLTERLPAWRVREALSSSMPAGFRLLEVHDVWLGAPALPGQVVGSVYRVGIAGADVDADGLERAVASLLLARALPRERQKGTGTVRYDLRPFIESLAVRPVSAAAIELHMTLRHDPERGIGRPDEVLAALGDAIGTPLEAATIVRTGLVLAPPPAPPALEPKGTRARRPGGRPGERPRS